jgi:hypothetical protein
VHHYVPQWYQRRFLPPGKTNFFYLDLNPKTITWPGGSHSLKDVRRLGPSACFYKEDLYTLKLGSWSTDQIESHFFGVVDSRGRDAVSYFAEFNGIEAPAWDAGGNLGPYMDAQKFRTPRGLDLIKKRSGGSDHNATLLSMQKEFKYTTMWMEATWEIVRARQSPTKFIVSDDPVTFYCKRLFPSDRTYPNEMYLGQTGTRTLFPLGLDSCLILTHVQLIRNPWNNPFEPRTNARSFPAAGPKYLPDIQYGRELEEDEVLRINYILKTRAVRFIAAAEEEWLHPERRVPTKEWEKLDDDWFLLPNLWRVSFHREIVIGHQGGGASAWDEYGRRPWEFGYKDDRQRDLEWQTCEMAKREWAVKRIGKSRAQTDERMGRDVADKMADDFLREQGLLYGPMERPYDFEPNPEVEE